jgi:predicted nuclease of predicted toxin-antitoxin system
MTTVRFQADADLKQSLVNGVLRRQPNLDFQSANAAELEGKKDQEVLAIAAKAGRVLVTHDRKTMPAEFGEFVMSQNSSGVLILSQSFSTSEAIEALILIWGASTSEEWVNQIMSIPF